MYPSQRYRCGQAAWLGTVTVFTLVVPAAPDKLRVDWRYIDSSISDTVGLAPGDPADGRYFHAAPTQGSVALERMRFERSGNFDPASIGQGGVGLYAPSGSSEVVAFEIADSEWVGNALSSGPALFLLFVRATLVRARCVPC